MSNLIHYAIYVIGTLNELLTLFHEPLFHVHYPLTLFAIQSLIENVAPFSIGRALLVLQQIVLSEGVKFRYSSRFQYFLPYLTPLNCLLTRILHSDLLPKFPNRHSLSRRGHLQGIGHEGRRVLELPDFQQFGIPGPFPLYM